VTGGLTAHVTRLIFIQSASGVIVRRKDKEIRDRTEIEEILQEARVCRIGLCDGSVPYCVPMSYCYRDGVIYLHSATEGRKLDILRRNNIVCFEVDTGVELIMSERPCKWSMRYRSVIGTGRAYFVDDLEGKREALRCIVRHYSSESGDHDFTDEELRSVVVIRIEIEEMSGKRSE